MQEQHELVSPWGGSCPAVLPRTPHLGPGARGLWRMPCSPPRTGRPLGVSEHDGWRGWEGTAGGGHLGSLAPKPQAWPGAGVICVSPSHSSSVICLFSCW